MLPATDGQPYNTVWRLHCDARTREYTLTVEYYSNLPPAKHQEVHDRIRQHVYQWLDVHGYDPARGKVEIKFMGRLQPSKVAEFDQMGRDDKEELQARRTQQNQMN